MRTEVHVHGTLNLCNSVTLPQVESGLRKWLEYLDAETLDEARSLEPEEPGIVFHRSDRTLEICWTGEVGRNFAARLQEVLHELGPLTESASHIELSFYHEDGRDEQQILFVGPSVEAIHQAQRLHMIEDVANVLSRHFGQEDVAQVTGLVNVLFDRDLEKRKHAAPDLPPPGASLLPFRKKHLHWNGFYEECINQIGKRLYAIEINDNPNVDASNEDRVLRDALCREVTGIFLKLIEARKRGTGR